MKKLIFTLLVVLLFSKLTIAGSFKPGSINEMIEIEFNKFKPVAEVNNIHLGHLIFTEDEYSHTPGSNPDIIINAGQIARYTKDSSDFFKSLFIKFVIAHELGHRIQFAGYRKEVIDKRQGEGMVFLECDADVLAGFLITQVFITVETPELLKDPHFDMAAYNRSLNGTAFSMYHRIFEMDKQNTQIKTHPSNIERMMAVKQGTILGNTYTYYMVLTHPDPNAAPLPSHTREQYKSLYESLKKAIGFNPEQGNPYGWAHDEAIRITHENNSLARNLIMFNREIQWNTSIDNPTVAFSFKVYNGNSNSVSFSGRVFTELIPRQDKQNIIRTAPVDGLVYDKVILPDQTVTISGNLQWLATTEYMPDIILPGEATSLYWVFDQYKPLADTTDVEVVDMKFDQWTQNSIEDLKDMVFTLLKKRSGFSKYIRGIGQSTAEETGDIKSGRIYYEPIFKESYSKDQKIYIDRSKSEIAFEFNAFSSPDLTITGSRFDEIVHAFSSSFPQFSVRPVSTSEKSRITEFRENDKKVIRLRIKYDAVEKIYRILFEFFGN